METGASSVAKVFTFCRELFFVDEEVVLFEAGHEAVHGVGNGDRDEDQVDIHADAEPGVAFMRWRRKAARLLLRQARRWQERLRLWGGGNVYSVSGSSWRREKEEKMAARARATKRG